MSNFWAGTVTGGGGGGLGGTPVSEYGDATANFNVETTILTYVVPASKTFDVMGAEVWGDYFAEWFLRVNGTQKGGTNLSAADRSKTLRYVDAPIPAVAGDVITVSVQHQHMGAVVFHANLMGRLNDA